MGLPTAPIRLNHYRQVSWSPKLDRTHRIKGLKLATNPKIGQEAAVVHFAAELLKGLEYDNEDRIVFTLPVILFLICERTQSPRLTFASWTINEILLLLQEDERPTSKKDPELQVIAEAITAFALKNRKQERDFNLPTQCTHESNMFLCLTMVGTCRSSTNPHHWHTVQSRPYWHLF